MTDNDAEMLDRLIAIGAALGAASGEPKLPEGWTSTEGDGSPYFTLIGPHGAQLQCVAPEDGPEPMFIRGSVSMPDLLAVVFYLNAKYPGIATPGPGFGGHE